MVILKVLVDNFFYTVVGRSHLKFSTPCIYLWFIVFNCLQLLKNLGGYL